MPGRKSKAPLLSTHGGAPVWAFVILTAFTGSAAAQDISAYPYPYVSSQPVTPYVSRPDPSGAGRVAPFGYGFMPSPYAYEFSNSFGYGAPPASGRARRYHGEGERQLHGPARDHIRRNQPKPRAAQKPSGPQASSQDDAYVERLFRRLDQLR